MAFRKVGGGDGSGTKGSKRFVKYSECEDGQILTTGVFLGTSEGRYGPQHEFREEDGVVAVLNSAGQLNFSIDHYVSPGDTVQVTYLGKEELKSGKMKGKHAHNFEVQVDDGLEWDEGAVVAVSKPAPKAKLAAAAAKAPKPVAKKPKAVAVDDDFEL